MEKEGISFDLGAPQTRSPHICRGMEIFLAIKGCAAFEANGEEIFLPQGGLFAANDGDVVSPGDGEGVLLSARISREYIRANCREILDWRYDCVLPEMGGELKYRELRRILLGATMCLYRRAPGYEIELRAFVFRLFHCLFVNFRGTERLVPALAGASEEGRIESILRYIGENYARNVALEDVARREYLSPSYLSRLFKRKTGVGFHDYVAQVRLAGTLDELTGSDRSLLKIAVDNGFGNAKSFASVFRKYYGTTPSAYRKKHRLQGGGDAESGAFDPERNRDELAELVEYMTDHDIRYDAGELVHCTASVEACEEARLFRPYNVLRLGKLAGVLREEVRAQCRALLEKIPFVFAHANAVFDDGFAHSSGHGDPFGDDYRQAIDFLRRLGLVPFLRFDESGAGEDAERRLRAFLEAMQNDFGRTEVEGWMFEIVPRRADSGFYRRLRAILKGYSERVRAGLFLDRIERAAEFSDASPDFLTMAFDPSREIDALGLEEAPYQQLKHYYVRKADTVSEKLAASGLRDLPIFVVDWNTLAGRTVTESGRFFRGALILDAILDVGARVEGMAYWLSTKTPTGILEDADLSVLSLFLVALARRPAFFVVEVLYRMGEELVFRNENVVVSRNEAGEYTLLVYNPCYFNPAYTASELFDVVGSHDFSVTLTGLPRGRCRFKKFTYDIGNSAAYKEIAKVGVHSLLDDDLKEHLEHAVTPSFSFFEDEIDGEWTLRVRLASNAVAFCVVHPLDAA